MLVGLSSVEDGPFQHEGTMVYGRRDGAERNVRRIERVVTERRQRDFPRGGAVHECHWTQRRFGNRSSGYRDARAACRSDAPHRGKLHKKNRLVLPIRDRLAIDCFPSLKNLAVS